MYYEILHWFKELVMQTAKNTEWLFKPTNLFFGAVQISPIMFFTFAGLTTFLSFAIIKWFAR